jgi:hypothetical protein
MLSFLAAPLFSKVEDIELSSGQPFPVSHSAYFAQDQLWQTLQQRM